MSKPELVSPLILKAMDAMQREEDETRDLNRKEQIRRAKEHLRQALALHQGQERG